jgi:hypothetical protein
LLLKLIELAISKATRLLLRPLKLNARSSINALEEYRSALILSLTA